MYSNFVYTFELYSRHPSLYSRTSFTEHKLLACSLFLAFFIMSTTIWSDESGNEDRLLDLIEERRALYDIEDSSYSNKVVKSRLWREISAELNIEGMRFCLLLLLYSTCAMQCCYEPPPLYHNILYICTRNYYQRPTLLFTLIWSTELSFCSFLRHCNGLHHTGLPI